MFGAILGLWYYDMPLDVFGQIGLVMLIGLETKNAILLVEFGVEMRRHRGMSILESAKAASRERLRPILMTSFAFVIGVLPMVRATGAGAYSRNSIGVVIAFGIAVSTILGRFVIPIYYVLGERLIDHFARIRARRNGDDHHHPHANGQANGHANGHSGHHHGPHQPHAPGLPAHEPHAGAGAGPAHGSPEHSAPPGGH
jgi:predicted RND superfamily exporter protein